MIRECSKVSCTIETDLEFLPNSAFFLMNDTVCFLQYPHLVRKEMHALCCLVFSDLLCVGLEGRSGSGKTALLKDFINILQKKNNKDVIFLHLGDQIDSKVNTTLICVP